LLFLGGDNSHKIHAMQKKAIETKIGGNLNGKI